MTQPTKTAIGIAKEILYLPVTNNQSETSIIKGAELIENYITQRINQLETMLDEAERVVQPLETAKILLEAKLTALEQSIEPMVDKWVSADERLPDANTRILAYVTEDGELFSIFDATYKGMNLFTTDGEYLSFVTHWKPIIIPQTTTP